MRLNSNKLIGVELLKHFECLNFVLKFLNPTSMACLLLIDLFFFPLYSLEFPGEDPDL